MSTPKVVTFFFSISVYLNELDFCVVKLTVDLRMFFSISPEFNEFLREVESCQTLYGVSGFLCPNVGHMGGLCFMAVYSVLTGRLVSWCAVNDRRICFVQSLMDICVWLFVL